VKLQLFSSRTGVPEPNLVAIQDAELEMVPTVLVCPLRSDESLTPVRVEVAAAGRRCVVLCELARPIHRRVLVAAGQLDDADSQRVMNAFRMLPAK
jgi:mRNA-degrading endonuclease toxin of MazEF toxin-antitoxin module